MHCRHGSGTRTIPTLNTYPTPRRPFYGHNVQDVNGLRGAGRYGIAQFQNVMCINTPMHPHTGRSRSGIDVNEIRIGAVFCAPYMLPKYTVCGPKRSFS